MSTLKDLKLSYQKKNTQFIIVDNKGKVLESDHTLFSLTDLPKIETIHPFFLSIDLKIKNKFTCVHLNILNKTLICDIEIKPIEDDNTLLILSDFSEHYNSFQSLAQSRNENAISTEVISKDNTLLKEKDTFKNKFISNFSHETISPLMSIMTFVNALKKTKLTKEQGDYINVISNSSYHLKAMINDVLDLSKIETGNLEINNIRFSLKKLIKNIDTEFAHRCKQKGLLFNTIYDDTMPNYIVSDKTRIYQIIKNLLENALKYTDKGEISLKIKPIYRHARNLTFSIEVKDTGTGISKENQQNIFDRFMRLENAKKYQGAGLGLTIIKEILPLLNGTIDLESEKNLGTTFTVNLKTKTPLNQLSHKKGKRPIQDKTNSNQLNLLIVDNNLADQLSIFKILASNKSFYLDIATNGKEAIDLVNTKTYDLILMDYNMPKLNGIKVSKSIKKINKNLSIILMTGSYISKDLSQYKGIYYDKILNKPFDEETLINSIYMCLK